MNACLRAFSLDMIEAISSLAGQPFNRRYPRVSRHILSAFRLWSGYDRRCNPYPSKKSACHLNYGGPVNHDLTCRHPARST